MRFVVAHTSSKREIHERNGNNKTPFSRYEDLPKIKKYLKSNSSHKTDDPDRRTQHLGKCWKEFVLVQNSVQIMIALHNI